MKEDPQQSSELNSKKAIDRLLVNLKARIEDKDLAGVKDVLDGGATSDLLRRVREQKLLVKAAVEQRDELAELLRDASVCLDLAERQSFHRYIDFALAIDAARTRCLLQLHATLRHMPRCSTNDLLCTAAEVFEWFLKKQFKLSNVSPIGVSVATAERRLHNLNGAVNDITMACARSVNECARVSPPITQSGFSRAERRRAKQVLREALKHAGEVNSLEWFFDMVAFDEFKVGITPSGDESAFRLEFVDPKRSLLAELSIRRTIILKYTGQLRPRFLRERLNDLGPALLERSIEHYLDTARVSERVVIDLDRARHTAAVMLRDVGIEDDLLVAASASRSDQRAMAFYAVSIALRWYSIAANALRASPQLSGQQWLAAPPIPLEEIATCLGGLQKEHLSFALQTLTVDLPARSHGSLVNRPFVRDGHQIARPFLSAEIGDWTAVVRETLIQGGALGKTVGSVWEDFYSEGFDGTGWRVVGKGVKLRERGKTLTDVDVLLLRDDLLLVIQIKALIGSSSGNPYENWRSRETVKFGCSQARIAADFLECRSEALIGICGMQAASRIRHVQPVVLTNIKKLDGWRVLDVPVIGPVTLGAICNGEQVDYRNSRSGEVVHTHRFSKREDLTTAAILRMFDEPLEMKIAEEGLETMHHTQKIGGITILRPDFFVATNKAVSAHEPKQAAVLKAFAAKSP